MALRFITQEYKILILCVVCGISIIYLSSSIYATDRAETIAQSFDIRSSANELPTLPDAILIGIGKCGTMALGFFLSLNLKISVTPNEVNFFCDDEKYVKGIEYYEQQMPQNLPKGSVILERSPDYWKVSLSAVRIKQTFDIYNRTVKIILIACDPTSRVLSWYVGGLYHYMEEGHPQDYPSLEKLVYFRGTKDICHYYTGVRTSKYDEQFQEWLNYFDRDKIHIIDGDSFKKNPLSELNKLERFLGLEPAISTKHIYFDEKKGFFCRNKKGKQECLDHTKGHTYPDLNPETIKKLQDYFRPHNRNFSYMAGVDFGWPV